MYCFDMMVVDFVGNIVIVWIDKCDFVVVKVVG